MINLKILQESEWNKAATLTERTAALRALCWNSSTPGDMVRAQRRLGRWKAQPPFDTGDYFACRLAKDQTNEDELLRLLNEEHPGLTGEPSPWLHALAQAFATPDSPTSLPAYDLPYFQESAGFLGAILPMVNQALERLQAGVKDLQRPGTALPFNSNAVPALFSVNLLIRLLAMLNRTMILELNVARLEGHLQGETPEERFQSFLLRLTDKEIALTLLREYPVLARHSCPN